MKANPYLPGTPDEFIEANLGLAQDVAWRFYLKSKQDERIKFDKDDFLSIAYLGLIKAYQKFDPSRFAGENGGEIKFSTYATPCIRGEIMRQTRDAGHMIRKHRDYEAAEVDSTDRKVFEDKTLGELISGTSHIDEEKIIINDLLDQMGPNVKKVYMLREYGYSQEEIGQRYGLSQVGVSRMELHLFKSAKQYGKGEAVKMRWLRGKIAS